MALHDRYERQLMRQRGAGSRTVGNTDFGLNFELESSRDDRQQMRQRGAGRKANPVNFGLSFQTPARNGRSATKTPVSIPTDTSRSTRASSKRQRESSSQPSRRTSLAKQTVVLNSPEASVVDVPSPEYSKRRKISGERSASTATNSIPEVSRPLANNSRRRSSRATFVIAEDDQVEAAGEAALSPSIRQSIVSPLFLPQHEKENQVPRAGQSKLEHPRNQRFSLRVQASPKSKTLPSPTLANSSSVHRNSGVSIEGGEDTVDSLDRPETHAEESLESPELLELREIPHLPTKKRKKRKSVVLGRRKRRSSENVQPVKQSVKITTHEPPPAIVVEIPQPGSERLSTESDPGSSHGSAAFRRTQRVADADSEDDEDGEYVDEDHTPEPPTPAPPRRGRKVVGRGQKISGDADARTATKSNTTKNGKGKSTFPILTHRMTQFATLPTIQEEDHANGRSDDDEEINFYTADKPTPNAIDVLAQICRETISNASEQVAVKGNSRGDRANMTRKRSALEAFGGELESRLFDMSAAVENRSVLESRVRKAKRQHAELQARWVEVRKERERIALGCDQIRRQHWESEQDAEERWRISEAAHEVELEIEGDDDQEVSLEYLLRTTVNSISNLANSGGVLGQVQTFNARLEKIAELLGSV